MAKHHAPKISPLVSELSGPLTGGPEALTKETPTTTTDFTASWTAYTQTIGVSVPRHLNRAAHAIRGMQGLRS